MNKKTNIVQNLLLILFREYYTVFLKKRISKLRVFLRESGDFINFALQRNHLYKLLFPGFVNI